MLRGQLKRNINAFTGRWMLLVVGIFLFYSSSSLREAVEQGRSTLEFVLLAVSDPYYLQYVLSISFIFAALRALGAEESFVLVRYKRFWHYWRAQVASIVAMVAMTVALHFLFAFTLGVFLPMGNRFTGGYSEDSALQIFSSYFRSPLAALVAFGLYLMTGLTVLGEIVMFLVHFFRHGTVVFTVIAAYIVSMIGFSAEYSAWLSPLFINNWTNFVAALKHTDGKTLIVIAAMGVLFAATMMAVRFFWNREIRVPLRRGRKRLVFLEVMLEKRKTLLVVGLGQLLLLGSVALSEKSLNFHDLLFCFFYGNHAGSIDLMALLRTMLYNGLPLYLLCAFLEKEATAKGTLQIIRLKLSRRWHGDVVRSALAFIFGYVFLSVLLLAVLSFVFGEQYAGHERALEYFAFDGIPAMQPGTVFASAVALRILELFMQFLAVFAMYTLCRSMAAVFLVLQTACFAGLVMGEPFYLFPCGLSSLARILEALSRGSLLSEIFICMAAWSAALYIVGRANHRQILMRGV